MLKCKILSFILVSGFLVQSVNLYGEREANVNVNNRLLERAIDKIINKTERLRNEILGNPGYHPIDDEVDKIKYIGVPLRAMANNFGCYKENRITQHTINYYFINKLDIETKGLFGASKNKNVNFIGFISNELYNLRSIMTNNICKKIVDNIISILNKNIYRILKKLSTQKQYDATDVDTLRRYARIVIDNLILLENAAGVEPERAD